MRSEATMVTGGLVSEDQPYGSIADRSRSYMANFPILMVIKNTGERYRTTRAATGDTISTDSDTRPDCS